MELDRRLLVAHCAAHILSVVAGLLVVVPMALSGSAFKGRCALFTTGLWRTENHTEVTGETGESSHLVVQQWGPPAVCQFITFVGVFTVLYGSVQGLRSIFYLHGRHDDTLFSAFMTLIFSLCVLFLSGGASLSLSLGLASWCNTVTDDNTRPYSCAESQSIPMYLDVETSSFYNELTLAEVALWSVTALWLTHSILSFLRLYHSHSQHISGPCLHREKEHLLGHSLSSSGSSDSDRGSPSPLLPQSTAPSVNCI
ncbi:hypothetical protein UPYG_G00212330 [Umbra pygmaea]|uniref:Transmembrane protein 179-like n=1 Tax=Umbra pygmaea TaxID=75934 RepID=A0ABD0WPU3_UMBPY